MKGETEYNLGIELKNRTSMKYLNQYHKERSLKAMQFVEQSKPVTHEQAVEQERSRRIAAGEDPKVYENFLKGQD